jgi:Flp pilus assembly protein TadD
MLTAEGRFEDAARELESLVSEHPASGRACAALCNLYIRLEKTEIPKELILNSLNHDKSLNNVLLDYSSLLFANDQFKECNNILEALVWGNPDNHEAWNDLGAVRFAVGDIVTSEQAFNQSLALHPGHGEAILNLTALYLETSRPEMAVQTATMALDERCDATQDMVIQLAGLIGDVSPEDSASLLREAQKKS